MTERKFSRATGDRVHKRVETQDEKQKSAEEKYKKQLMADYAKVAGSAAGLNVLRHIFATCGYHLPSIAQDASFKVDLHGTLHNAAMRSVWDQIRPHMDTKTLKKVEYND